MVAGPAGWRWVMWWSMPEAGEQQGEGATVRRLAVAGSMQRRQRTVLTLVPLRDVHPNPDQPRKHFDDEKLGELAASIKAHGLLQPIVVRPTAARSEEHTSELQSHSDLVCRLLLEKKKITNYS